MKADTRIPFVGLCGAEWRKIRGRGLVWAVLLVGFVHGLLAPLLIKGILFLGDKTSAPSAEALDPADWLVGGDLALSAAVFPVNGFAILLLAAILWSEDFSLGTMAMIFVRPVSRWKVFAGKAVVAWGVGFLSLSIATAVGLALGVLLLGFSGDVGQLASFPLLSWMAEPPTTSGGLPTGLGAGVRIWRMALALGVGVLLIGPIVAMTAFVASVARSPIWTLSGSLVLLLIDAFSWLFTAAWGASNLRYNELAGEVSHWTISGSWWSLYRLHGSSELFAEGWSAMAITCGWTALLGGLALWMFLKRDVT